LPSPSIIKEQAKVAGIISISCTGICGEDVHDLDSGSFMVFISFQEELSSPILVFEIRRAQL
jgi:hypothetical protein